MLLFCIGIYLFVDLFFFHNQACQNIYKPVDRWYVVNSHVFSIEKRESLRITISSLKFG